MPGGAARILLSKDPTVDGGVSVKVEVAAHEMGMGTATAQTQVTADRLGLSMDCVEVCYGDSRFPGVVLAGGSQQTASIGSAVMAAQAELIAALLALAVRRLAAEGSEARRRRRSRRRPLQDRRAGPARDLRVAARRVTTATC